MKEIVLIAGGNGLVGSYLKTLLTFQGYEVRILSRSRNSHSNNLFYWNPEKQEIDENVFKDLDYLIQLSGANLADKRWTAARKQELIHSRIQSTQFLYSCIKEYQVPLKAYIGTSAVGYYGSKASDQIFNETDTAGNDFLANLCVEWEKIHHQFEDLGIRTIIMRFGVVLAREGGALDPLSKTVQYGMGAVLGNGNQIIPWIHVHDLCKMLHYLLEQKKLNGIYNAVAPHPVSNREMMYALAKQMKRKIWLPPVPAFVLKLILGEMSEMVLTGNKINASKMITSGFQFKYPTLEIALQDLLTKKVS